jgi:hypothetical protein
MENLFAPRWKAIESARPIPRFLRKLVKIDFNEVKSKVLSKDEKFADQFVESIYSGDAYIFQNVFDPKKLRNVREAAHEYGKKTPSVSAKVLDGCPDNHVATDTSGRTEGYQVVDHSYFFFRWNDDPLGLFSMYSDIWKIFKTMSGNEASAFEKNIPSQGLVDRIQVIHYPSGAGKITVHADPTSGVQKMLIGTPMTEAGKDYQKGGFFVLNEKKEIVNFEKEIELGSMTSVFPGMFHGVDIVDSGENVDLTSDKGRWYISLFTITSHHVHDRPTALPPELA